MRTTDTVLRLRRAVAERRAADPGIPEPALPPPSALRDHLFGETLVAGCRVLRLTPRHQPDGEHLVYTHGGGYTGPLQAAHWWMLTRLLRGTGLTLTVPLYPLAPQGHAAGAYAFLAQVYDDVVAEAGAEHVTLAGDSAGGALALGQAQQYRDHARPLPRQVVLIAPWLDATLSHPRVPELARRDAMLRVDPLVAAGRLWARDLDPADPRVSPGAGSVEGLPPVHVFQGGRDLLAADVDDLLVRLTAAGNPGGATVEPDGFHVYPVAHWTAEGRSALGRIRGLLAPDPVDRTVLS